MNHKQYRLVVANSGGSYDEYKKLNRNYPINFDYVSHKLFISAINYCKAHKIKFKLDSYITGDLDFVNIDFKRNFVKYSTFHKCMFVECNNMINN